MELTSVPANQGFEPRFSELVAPPEYLFLYSLLGGSSTAEATERSEYHQINSNCCSINMQSAVGSKNDVR